MPNRYVREGILTSEAIASLKWQEEVFYRRLINKVDDFGRYYAHPSLLRAALYPLQLESVRDSDMPRWLAACEAAGLMYVYNQDGKNYVALSKWEKGRAVKSHFPAPPAEIEAKMKGEPIASGGKFSGSDGGTGQIETIAPNLGASAPELPPIPTTIPIPIPTTIPEGEAVASVPPSVGVADLVEAWNKKPGVPHVQQITDKRKAAARVRLAEPFFASNWREAIDRIAASPFCIGDNDRGWRADFDWFLQTGVVVSVMEGKYSNNARQPAPAPTVNGKRESGW